MACYEGEPHIWTEIPDRRDGKWVRLRCIICEVKKWKVA